MLEGLKIGRRAALLLAAGALLATTGLSGTAARAADLLLGRDDWGAAWIAAFRAAKAAQQLSSGGTTPRTPRGMPDSGAIVSDMHSASIDAERL